MEANTAGFQGWYERNTAIAWLIGIIAAAIVGIAGLIINYKASHAEELRTLVYQPLYDDLVEVEKALKAVSIAKMPPTKALNHLKQNGGIERIPSNMKERLIRVSQEAGDAHMAASEVHEIVIREMSSRIMVIRSERADREWLAKTTDALREMTMSKKGISDRVTLIEGATHDYISKTWDLRDPTRTEPGGPVFVVRDWLEYPASIKTLEPIWKTDEYLHFHLSKSESWYYRVTREDLNRNNTTLEEFLKPVHETLKQNSNFQKLLTERQSLLAEIADLKNSLRDRVRDPKQMRDLFNL